jgi:hypothetical protein
MLKKNLLLSFAIGMGFSFATIAQNFNWVKKIGGTSADYGQIVKVDVSGNFIIAGNYSGTIDLDPSVGVSNVTSSGNQDIFIVKLDANKNFVWGKSVGGSNVDAVSDLVIDNTNNIILCGFFRGTADFDPSSATFNLSTGNIGADGFILKLNSSGNYVYAKQIGGTATVDEHVISITLDNQGNLFATGYFNNTCDLDPGTSQFNVTSIGGADIFIIKLDVNGNFLFGKSIGGTSGSTSLSSGSIGYSIKIDNSNNILISGRFDGTQDFDPNSGVFNLVSNGQLDCFVLKLDNLGNFVFAKSLGSSGIDVGWSIQLNLNGDIYLSGEFTNTVDFDPNTGVSTLSSSGQADGFMLKLSNSGSFLWVNKIGGVGSDLCGKITLDQNENVFTCGYFNGSVDFDNSSNQNILNSNGMKDAFLAAYSSNGNFIYAQNYGSSSDDEGAHLYLSNSEIYLTGYFQNTVDFDAGTNTNNITSAGSQDAFILSLTNNFCTQIVYNTVTIYDTVTVYTSVTDTLIINTSVIGINPPNNVNTVKVFPNPASTHITIDYGNFAIMNGYQLKIENSIGQQVFQININQQSSYLNLSTWGGNGIYFVRIIDPQGNTVDIRKIVLQ